MQQLLSERSFNLRVIKERLSDLALVSKNMQEVLSGIFEENDPLYKVLATRLVCYEGAPLEKLSPSYASSLYYMLCSADLAAHKESGEEEDFTGLLSVKGGNSILPEKLSQMLIRKPFLNKVLKSVSKGLDGSFALAFQDRQMVAADVLILAIPCPVYESIEFEEGIIPKERLDDIKNVQYGTNAKIMIPFTLPSEKRIRFNNGRIGCFFDVNCNILTLNHVDAASLFSQEAISETCQLDWAMIEAVFGGICPSFKAPVLAKDKAFSIYEEPVAYAWESDPYAKGSYSYTAAGKEKTLAATERKLGETVKALFAPIDQKLYFAGEHASILEASGTMEAACESGERVARMINRAFSELR